MQMLSMHVAGVSKGIKFGVPNFPNRSINSSIQKHLPSWPNTLSLTSWIRRRAPLSAEQDREMGALPSNSTAFTNLESGGDPYTNEGMVIQPNRNKILQYMSTVRNPLTLAWRNKDQTLFWGTVAGLLHLVHYAVQYKTGFNEFSEVGKKANNIGDNFFSTLYKNTPFGAPTYSMDPLGDVIEQSVYPRFFPWPKTEIKQKPAGWVDTIYPIDPSEGNVGCESTYTIGWDQNGDLVGLSQGGRFYSSEVAHEVLDPHFNNTESTPIACFNGLNSNGEPYPVSGFVNPNSTVTYNEEDTVAKLVINPFFNMGTDNVPDSIGIAPITDSISIGIYGLKQ